MTEEFEHIWEEDNVVESFIYDNRPCIVVFHPRLGHYCGYVKTTLPSLSHSSISYYEGENYVNLVEINGGITYGIGEDGWVGFDCGHSWDVCWREGERTSGDIAVETEDDHRVDWHEEDVVDEVKYLADQISALEQYLGNNFPQFNTY